MNLLNAYFIVKFMHTCKYEDILLWWFVASYTKCRAWDEFPHFHWYMHELTDET